MVVADRDDGVAGAERLRGLVGQHRRHVPGAVLGLEGDGGADELAQLPGPFRRLGRRTPRLPEERDALDRRRRPGGELLDGGHVRRPEAAPLRAGGAGDGPDRQTLDPHGHRQARPGSDRPQRPPVVGVDRVGRRRVDVLHQLGAAGGHHPADGPGPAGQLGGQGRQRGVGGRVGVAGGHPLQDAVDDQVDGAPVGEGGNDDVNQRPEGGDLVVCRAHERPSALRQEGQMTAGLLGGEAGATLGLLEPRPGLVLHPGQFGGPGAAVPDRTFRGRAPVPRRAERRALIPLRQEWGP